MTRAAVDLVEQLAARAQAAVEVIRLAIGWRGDLVSALADIPLEMQQPSDVAVVEELVDDLEYAAAQWRPAL